MKNRNKISALALLVFIAAFSAMTILNVSKKFPEIPPASFADGSFTDDLSASVADSFACREKWISISAKLEAGIRESIVNDVYISKKRLLSADMSSVGVSGDFIETVNGFSKPYDGATYFVAVPTSSGVYSEMLPPYLVATTEKQQIDRLYEQLDSDIRKIDAYNILKMLSNNYIYYRSDSKWTSYGAFCVYRTVIQKLGFMPVSYDKYTVEHVTDDYRGNLYDKTKYMESKPDLLDIYEYSGGSEVTECKGYDNNGMVYRRKIYDREAAESDDRYNLYLGGNLPFFTIKTDVSNSRKILVIGDDYASCFIPFLTQHYSEIAVLFPEYMEKDFQYFANTEDYGQTLFLFGIDSLGKDIFDYMR